MSEPDATTRTGPAEGVAEALEPPPEEEPARAPEILLRLGGTIVDVDDDAAAAARGRLIGDGASAYGRLGELAIWWASVRGTPDAPAPRQVLLAGGGSDVAARRTGVRALAFPRGGSVDDGISWGVAEADRAADCGTDLLLLCLEDTAPWRALAADLLAMDAVEASGWPLDRGLSDERWMDEVAALRDRLRLVRGLRSEPAALLNAIGSPALAAAAALLVAATARRTPVLLDGPGAAAVALLVLRANYAAPRWWQAAHRGDDRLHERALGSVGLEPLTQLEIRVSDGTAALAGLALLDAAVALIAPADLACAD
jgi:nicotinate-nucleotide--dimethylbenzimidazole phosphoribosyltransferase